jgi:hypothetical protein
MALGERGMEPITGPERGGECADLDQATSPNFPSLSASALWLAVCGYHQIGSVTRCRLAVRT